MKVLASKDTSCYRTKSLALVSCLIAASVHGYAQSTASPLPAGSIGAQVLGRVRLQPDLSVKLYGYFTYVRESGVHFQRRPE